MRASITVLTLSLLIGVLPVHAATNQTAQQKKMTTCNAQATDQQMSGDARKAFMKTCLSSSAHVASNSQQQRMKQCNSDAASKHLTGDARKQFMSTCLKKEGGPSS